MLSRIRFWEKKHLPRRPSDIELKVLRDSSDENLTYEELVEGCSKLDAQNKHLKDEFRIMIAHHQQLVAERDQVQRDRDARPNITIAEHQQLVAQRDQAQRDRDARPNITIAGHQQLVDDLAQAQRDRDERLDITTAEHQQLVAERDQAQRDLAQVRGQLMTVITERDTRPTIAQHQQVIAERDQVQRDLAQVQSQLMTATTERDERPPILLVDYERRMKNYSNNKSFIRTYEDQIRTATGKKIVLSP